MKRRAIPAAGEASVPPQLDLLQAPYDRRAHDRAAETHAPPAPFDPLGVPLDPGISLVEASAGTGKTFSITLTVLRCLLDRDAEGAYRVDGIGDILVVTFGKAATDELVTRVRAALRDAVDVFAGVAERTEKNGPLFDLRARYGAGETGRLRDALAALDRLSIFTIHGWSKRVLEESALESGTPYDAAFLEDDASVIDRVAQDWWRRTVYEDARLAALAVHDDWSYDSFLGDLAVWRRWPGTRLDPDQRLDDALAVLDAAVARLAGVWDTDAAAALLDGLGWLADAPLGDPRERQRAIASGAALARGDFTGGLALVERCTAAALHHEKKGMRKLPRDVYARVPEEPLVRACDAIALALDGVRRALRVDCLVEVERAFAAEKRRRHLLGFDDLLRRLRDALQRGGPDGPLARAIRRRWKAALIDEFQDTDPFQFPIFSTAFAGCPLFLIGDPKQAIYGFRGADVFAYMSAARSADRRWTLGRNWRSTAAMVGAVNALFTRRPDAFLYGRIPFVPAEAARAHEDPLVSDPSSCAAQVGRAALHWWFVPPTPDGKPLPRNAAEPRLHAALGREVVRLMRSRERGGAGLAPRGIAVLVRTGYEGLAVQRVLRRAGVPCIVAGLGDILQSRELRELEAMLRAILAPQNGRAMRAALATEMWGASAADIHRLAQPEHEAEWQTLIERLAAARESWVRHGFMRMVQEWIVDAGIPERLLAFEDGERRLTNLRHAIELLHAAAVEERLSPEGLLLWIAQARARRSEDAERTELRLESDADAVQIVTVHRAKGLEYDVVFCPGLWAARRAGDDRPVLVHLKDGSVVFDHGSPARAERGRLADAEQLAEDLRLLYVALTRARFRCYLGWGAISSGSTGVGAWDSALGYLLRDDDAAGEPEDVVAQVSAALHDSLPAWSDTLDALVAASGGTMTRETLSEAGAEPERWEGAAAAPVAPTVRDPLPAVSQLETWRIASFTSLTAARHGLSGSGRGVDDPRDVSDVASSSDVSVVPARRDDFMAFPAGRHAGVVLHELFERLDWAAPPADVRALAAELLLRERLAADERDGRVDAVAGMAERVLGCTLPGADFALRDVPAGRTLREWSFHLPLGRVDRRTFAELFAAHGTGVASRYAPALRALAPDRTHGFLTGVVDVAFERDGRWHVVDWKSNHLGPEPERYEGGALEEAMIDHHYVLQYHLYVTALHRFLRARVPGYDYDRHMGGVWYAFLRGVDARTAGGWFHDRPARSLVDALDALMDAGAAGRDVS